MGVTAVLAMLMTGLAYLAQSPRALLRLGLGGYRLDLRVKLFTGYALASLILMLGFFLAGVPIDDSTRTTAVTTPNSDTADDDPIAAESGAMSEPIIDSSTDAEQAIPTNSNLSSTDSLDETTTQTPSSGAFGGPPAGSTDEIATEVIPPTATPEQAGPSATPDGSSPATAEFALSLIHI